VVINNYKRFLGLPKNINSKILDLIFENTNLLEERLAKENYVKIDIRLGK